ncbi:MAG: preprotein translocase subunit YajC [Planctomycetota bacterium]|nr:MAG: preprotein translocase subunit YajC [Planctomycetota bacterium]
MKRITAGIIAALAALLLPAPAWAEGGNAGSPPPGGGLIVIIIYLLPLAFIFYFFVMRPEKKRRQQHQQMIASLGKGDRIITIGGIFGKIIEVRADEGVLVIEVDDKTRLRISLDAVARKVEQS